jgi:hypothetical protein
MRRLAMFAALLIVAGCQAADAPTPQIIYVTAPPSPGSPSMASIPSPATATPAAATSSPTTKPKPTPTPRPTLRPASLSFGTLSYNATGCWNSNIQDPQGHTFGGVPVDFSLTITNKGQRKSGYVWLATSTNDTSIQMLDGRVSWGAQLYALGDANSVALPGPEIPPGRSETLSWTMYFITPFDVNYTIAAVVSSTGETTPAPDSFFLQSAIHWTLLTTASIC